MEILFSGNLSLNNQGERYDYTKYLGSKRTKIKELIVYVSLLNPNFLFDGAKNPNMHYFRRFVTRIDNNLQSLLNSGVYYWAILQPNIISFVVDCQGRQCRHDLTLIGLGFGWLKYSDLKTESINFNNVEIYFFVFKKSKGCFNCFSRKLK